MATRPSRIDLAAGAANLVNFWSVLGLAALLAAGAAAIAWARAWRKQPGEDRVDWENMLANCKNLKSQGVLSEDEYRKIRTLVEHRRSSP